MHSLARFSDHQNLKNNFSRAVNACAKQSQIVCIKIYVTLPINELAQLEEDFSVANLQIERHRRPVAFAVWSQQQHLFDTMSEK